MVRFSTSLFLQISFDLTMLCGANYNFFFSHICTVYGLHVHAVLTFAKDNDLKRRLVHLL
jgi:hypothetical protein